MEKKKWAQWIYWFTLGLAIVFIYKTLDSFTAVMDWIKGIFNVLMPFIIAILIAYIFYIPARKIENIYSKTSVKWFAKRAKGFSVLTIYLIAAVILIAIIKFVLPSISDSVKDLFNSLPGYYNSAIEYVNNLPEDSTLNKLNVKSAINDLKDVDFSKYVNAQDLSGFAVESVKGATNFVLNAFIAIIVSIYLLLERKEILEFVRKLCSALFKKKTYTHLGKYFKKTNVIFYKFISAQVIDAVVVGTIISIALSIMNVKYGILLGFMIGLLNIIPYFGAIIGVVIAVIITIFTGGLTKAIVMTIVVVILQQIDANIINPKIVGNSLKLSPILIIFAVTIGGAYFGILGMFLAVPVIAILKILVLDYIELKNLSTGEIIKRKINISKKP